MDLAAPTQDVQPADPVPAPGGPGWTAVPLEHDERLRPSVVYGAPDVLDRRLASWLVPTLAARLRDLQEVGVDLDPPAATASLALAVLEAVWTPRVDVTTTGRVVAGFREAHGPDAGAESLVEAVRRAGGDEAWARDRATRHRVLPSVDAPLKATAAREAAQVLIAHGVAATGDLLSLLDAARAVPDPARPEPEHPHPHPDPDPDPDPERFPTVREDLTDEAEIRAARERWDAVRRAWCAVPGQGSGRSWHRLLVLAGAGRVVPDDDVRRFVSRWHRGHQARWASGGMTARASTVPDVWVSARLLELAGELAGATPREVDHVAWRSELLRTPATPPPARGRRGLEGRGHRAGRRADGAVPVTAPGTARPAPRGSVRTPQPLRLLEGAGEVGVDDGGAVGVDDGGAGAEGVGGASGRAHRWRRPTGRLVPPELR